MGGRSSSFTFTSAEKSRVKRTDTYEKDTETIRRLNIVEKLKNRNIKVMASSDIIPYDIITPNLKAIDKIMSKTREYGEFLGEKEIKIRAEKFENPNTVACFSVYLNNFERPQIIYNKSFANKSEQDVINQADEQIKAKSWTPVDKYNYVNKVILHEMSHFIQYYYIDKISKIRGEVAEKKSDEVKYMNKIAAEMKSEILKIAKKDFNNTKDIPSIYGGTNNKEFFAEAFSEVLGTEREQDMSPIAKATNKYIRRLNQC